MNFQSVFHLLKQKPQPSFHHCFFHLSTSHLTLKLNTNAACMILVQIASILVVQNLLFKLYNFWKFCTSLFIGSLILLKYGVALNSMFLILIQVASVLVVQNLPFKLYNLWKFCASLFMGSLILLKYSVALNSMFLKVQRISVGAKATCDTYLFMQTLQIFCYYSESHCFAPAKIVCKTLLRLHTFSVLHFSWSNTKKGIFAVSSLGGVETPADFP